MKVEVKLLLQQLADEMDDLFVFLGEEGKYDFPKRHGSGGEEGFVTDVIACYDLRLKKIFFCEKNFLSNVRTYGINERYSRVFTLHVLLHEFTHYALDLLNLQKHFHKLPTCARFDEPFCEYISLRACVNRCLKLFNYAREIIINEDEKKFLSILSSIQRPIPYVYFREIYARPENILGEPAEVTFLRLKSSVLEAKTQTVNFDQNIIFRSLFWAPHIISPKEIYTCDLKRKIRPVGVVNVPLSH